MLELLDDWEQAEGVLRGLDARRRAAVEHDTCCRRCGGRAR